MKAPFPPYILKQIELLELEGTFTWMEAESLRKWGRWGPGSVRDLPWSHRKSVMSRRKNSVFLYPS